MGLTVAKLKAKLSWTVSQILIRATFTSELSRGNSGIGPATATKLPKTLEEINQYYTTLAVEYYSRNSFAGGNTDLVAEEVGEEGGGGLLSRG